LASTTVPTPLRPPNTESATGAALLVAQSTDVYAVTRSGGELVKRNEQPESASTTSAYPNNLMAADYADIVV